MLCGGRFAGSCVGARRSSTASRPLPLCSSSAASSGSVLASPANSRLQNKWAVVEFDGLKQFVEEGQWFCIKKRPGLKEGAELQLSKVLALLDDDGKFHNGRPYVPNACVEALLVEEYTGPSVPSSLSSAAGAPVAELDSADCSDGSLSSASGSVAPREHALGKVLVKRITHKL